MKFVRINKAIFLRNLNSARRKNLTGLPLLTSSTHSKWQVGPAGPWWLNYHIQTGFKTPAGQRSQPQTVASDPHMFCAARALGWDSRQEKAQRWLQRYSLSFFLLVLPLQSTKKRQRRSYQCPYKAEWPNRQCGIESWYRVVNVWNPEMRRREDFEL